ncbi:MAG TPA: sigma-70 family RNA polymerase sigma factor, partial [Ktedonobacterales bacterium]
STLDRGEWLAAARLAAILKGSGVGENQDDRYAARRAELEAQFHALPLPGKVEYWRRIEDTHVESALPLEVVARCIRERVGAGAISDAHRIYEVIARRLQSGVGKWAWMVARTARSGMKPELQEDLAQQCYIKLWEELAGGGKTFLLDNFVFALHRICQHVAREMMEQAGEWPRPGVETPTRIPRAEMESIEAKPKGEEDVPFTERIPDNTVQDAFDQVELSDLLDLVEKLPEDQRNLIFGLYFEGRSQKEIGEELDISDRMVRYRLKMILQKLAERYQGGEGGNHA